MENSKRKGNQNETITKRTRHSNKKTGNNGMIDYEKEQEDTIRSKTHLENENQDKNLSEHEEEEMDGDGEVENSLANEQTKTVEKETIEIDQDEAMMYDVSDTENDVQPSNANYFSVGELKSEKYRSKTVLNGNLQGRLVKVLPKKLLAGRRKADQSYWQLIVVLADETLLETIKVVIWGDHAFRFEEVNAKYFDMVRFDGVEFSKNANVDYNWCNSPFIASVGERHLSKTITKANEVFDFKKINYERLDNIPQGQVNLSGKVIKIETKCVHEVTIKTIHGSKTINFWKLPSGEEIDEFSKIEKGNIYGFLGVWSSDQTLSALNNIKIIEIKIK